MENATGWLDAWGRAAAQPPLERAITLLATAAGPGAREDDLANLPIGERDAALLRLRAQLFGDRAVAVVDCPRCAGRLETAFQASDLLEPRPADSVLTFVAGGREVTLRRVTTADLRAVAGAPTAAALLERVIVAPPGSDLPEFDQWLEEAARRLAMADPQAHVEMAVRCPECSAEWTEGFDIATFLWQEFETWATRTMHEVHVLASAYGWSEREILDLPPWRRRRYLELVER